MRVDRAWYSRLAVGASELGALIGCDPYTTPLQLYRRKRGLEPDQADNDRMRVGRELEGAVVDLVRRRLPLPIRRNRQTLAHHTAPLFATPDAFVGPDRLLEVKVVGVHSALDEWSGDDLPCRVRLQVAGQLAVTGRDACYVAALIGSELRLIVVERDPELVATVLAAASAFVDDHVDPGVPPDPSTWDERWAQLLEVVVGLPPLEAYATAAGQALGDRLLEARDQAARLEDEIKADRLELLHGLEAAGSSRLVGNGWAAAIQATKYGRTLVVRREVSR